MNEEQKEFKRNMLNRIGEFSGKLESMLTGDVEELIFDDYVIVKYPTGLLQVVSYHHEFTFDFYSIHAVAEFLTLNEELFLEDEDEDENPLFSMPCGCPAKGLHDFSDVKSQLLEGNCIQFGTEWEEGWEHGFFIYDPEEKLVYSKVFLPDGDETGTAEFNIDKALQVIYSLVEIGHSFTVGKATASKEGDVITIICGNE